MKQLIIYTDGGARGNPGPSAAAFIIYDEKGDKVDQGGAVLGVSTNNQAEYCAVKLALERVFKNYKKELPLILNLRLDSNLVVEQLKGNFKIKNIKLADIAVKIQLLIKKIGKVNLDHIPREQNKEADFLVNKILDEQ